MSNGRIITLEISLNEHGDQNIALVIPKSTQELVQGQLDGQLINQKLNLLKSISEANQKINFLPRVTHELMAKESCSYATALTKLVEATQDLVARGDIVSLHALDSNLLTYILSLMTEIHTCLVRRVAELQAKVPQLAFATVEQVVQILIKERQIDRVMTLLNVIYPDLTGVCVKDQDAATLELTGLKFKDGVCDLDDSIELPKELGELVSTIEGVIEKWLMDILEHALDEGELEMCEKHPQQIYRLYYDVLFTQNLNKRKHPFFIFSGISRKNISRNFATIKIKVVYFNFNCYQKFVLEKISPKSEINFF